MMLASKQTMTLDEKLKEIPRASGVYLHKDAEGKIIYIGKAKNLRNRVRSYFQAGRRGEFSYGIKTEELVNQIADVEFIVTDNEAEAFILEASLVKQHQPYFNYKLKDDKSYPHLKLTVNEPFPKCVITRRIQNDGALYFGPFLPASMARRTIDLINRTFQLRTCDIEIDGKAPLPCLEYHIKRCLGPCVKGLCTPEEYQEAVRDVRMLLEGRNTELADKLEARMLQASDEMRYELAAKYRDLRKTVIKLSEQQKMATTSESDIDIFGYYREGRRLALQLFTMREGDIVGRREFFWEDLPEDEFNPADFLSEVLAQYYSSSGTAVAGMVVCENGKMNRNEYRKFKIRWVEGANDFASMHEAVLRRYRRVRDEEKALPDLVIIDGGKSQLKAAAEAMRELDLEAVPMISVVKPPLHHNQVAYLLVKGRENEPIYLDSYSPVLRLIQMVRDETHRYAVTYHRKRRELRDFTS